MVAKTYLKWQLMSEPFEKDGKEYVKMRNRETKVEKVVRWYNVLEFHKLYPDEPIEPETDPYYHSDKLLFGFEAEGYITIYTGEGRDPESDFFKASPAYYSNRVGGWFLPSDLPPLTDLPLGVRAIQLDWELVGDDSDDSLKTNSASIVNSFLSKYYKTGTTDISSSSIGAVGTTVELNIKVLNVTSKSTRYGTSYFHLMEDADGNKYTWNTTSKSWSVGTEHHIKAKIKEISEYNGEKRTALTYCKDI